MQLSRPAEQLLGLAPARVLERLSVVSEGLTGRRIAALAGLPTSSTNRALGELERTGLVTSQPVGAAKLYRLNRHHVLWAAIEQMMDAPARVEQLLAATVHDSVGARASASIYGSAARGEATAESDLDVVVIWAGRVAQSEREALLARLSEVLQSATGNHVEIVDLTREELRRLSKAHDPLVESWRREARTVSGTDLKDLIGSTAA